LKSIKARQQGKPPSDDPRPPSFSKGYPPESRDGGLACPHDLAFRCKLGESAREEKSPYLLQHRDNPVDWYPWEKEAFDRARQENKPVFVSIGYSTCHWCHVMARESFENPQTAKLLNEHFVNVKVDREERPDVDRFCMAFVQATSGSGAGR
jgi:hypothetical protein